MRAPILSSPTILNNGSECQSRAMDAWAFQRCVQLAFIWPGKSIENSFIESFKGRLRDECLNTHLFISLDDAQRQLKLWRTDYNVARPHSALGDRTPNDVRQAHEAIEVGEHSGESLEAHQ